jgi:precorrin-4 methylase
MESLFRIEIQEFCKGVTVINQAPVGSAALGVTPSLFLSNRGMRQYAHEIARMHSPEKPLHVVQSAGWQ